jgi:predicted nucleotidyltransferase
MTEGALRVDVMANLKGRNQIRRFQQVAEKLVAQITTNNGVSGVVIAGGLVRGFADQYSDVDITVFLSKKNRMLRKKIGKLGSDEQRITHVDIDLEVHFIEDFRKRKLHEMQKWDFSHIEIVFDPEGKIERLMTDKVRVPQSYWVRRVVVYAELLKWYCCPPETRIGTIAQAWVERGDLVSAHYCTDYSLDLIIKVLFALNKEFLPPPKWRIFYSHNLKWLPKRYGQLLKEIMLVHELSLSELERRLNALKELWRGILPRIEKETGLTPSSISRYYVQRILHQR